MVEIVTTITGDVFDVRGEKDAKLQFLKQDENGTNLIEVKVKGATRSDLLRFKGKKVVCSDVNIYHSGFLKYYSVDGLSKVKELSK